MKNSQKSVSMRYGFTLVELLVVITIIALLATFAAPGLYHAQELARRGKCRGNVQSVAKSCILYMADDRMHRRSTRKKAMPALAVNVDWSSATSGNPAALWLLVTNRSVGRGTFLCPSAAAYRDFERPDIDDMSFTGNTLSYSYLSQVAFTDGNTGADIEVTSLSTPGLKMSELAVIADANPRGQIGTSSFDDEYNGRNSFNHDSAGQNVAFLDGHADWLTTTTVPGTRPLVSSNEPDDIYRSCKSGSDGDGKRGAVNDAFLIP